MISEAASDLVTLATSLKIGALLLAGSFLIYGFTCLFTVKMKQEFLRYGLEPFRTAIGVSQVLTAFVFFVALYKNWIAVTMFLFLFLSIMMAVALWVRIRIKDSLAQALPALAYFIFSFTLLILSILDQWGSSVFYK